MNDIQTFAFTSIVGILVMYIVIEAIVNRISFKHGRG